MVLHPSGDIAPKKQGWPLSRWIFIGFAVVAGYYLLTEHTAHVFAVLPFALILACPLMHLFMHHGGDHAAPGGGKQS